jgi:GntR family transcriptional regulator
MFFDINTQNGVPVYEQVFRQITFAIANGGLASGEIVPSVRQMARELAINPNTVARAYRQLQDEGIVETMRGSGLMVTVQATRKCKSLRTSVFKLQFETLIDEALQSQLAPQEIRELFEEQLSKAKR